MAPNNEQNEHQYETQDYAGDRATDTYRVMQHMPDEDRSSRADLQNSITDRQATELSSDVRMGDDRVISDTPNWQGFTSEQLYNFATQNNDPTSADTLGRGFTDGGNRLAEAANGLFEAVSALEGAWSGVAADSARAALAPLAKAAGNTGQTAQMMGVQMSRQSIAATEVRKLPPPEDFDQQQQLQAMVAGGPAAMQADLKAQKEAADAVKREQITYLDAYTQTMSAVDAQTPSFVPPPERSINAGAGNSSITGSAVPVPGAGGGGVGGTNVDGPPGGWVGAAPGASSGAAPGMETGELDTSDLNIPGSLPGTSAAGYTPTPSTAPPSSIPTTGIGPLGGGPSVPAAGAGGFGGAFGNFGGGGGTGGAGGVGTGQGAGPGAGPRGVPSGMAPGGGAPGRGAGGGMGAGGRKGQGEEDDEHERPSYLVEGDPDSAFGNDQMTAPSVIGDDGDD